MTVYTACQQTPSPAPSFSIFSFFISAHTHTYRHKLEIFRSTSARFHVRSHPPRSEDGHWLESVFVILILCFFTSPSQGPSPLLSLLLLLQSGRLGAILESENIRSAEGRKLPTKRDWKMKKRAKGRREGQCFPSTAIHDLILFRSAETFPGMRICCKKQETNRRTARRR